jgi:hypothetical protein
VTLYERILADQLAENEPASTPREVAGCVLPSILNRLIQLQATLSDLQTQVEQSIQELE